MSADGELNLSSSDDWDVVDCRPSAGTGTLARIGRVLLLVGSTDPAAVAPLLDQAELVAANGGQGRQLVRGYALLLGTATADTPDFVALAPHTTGLAVLVQGDASVEVNGDHISGRDSLAWVERLVPWPITSLEAKVDGGAVARPHLRLGGGVIEAGGLVLATHAASSSSGILLPQSLEVPTPAPLPDPVALAKAAPADPSDTGSLPVTPAVAAPAPEPEPAPAPVTPPAPAPEAAAPPPPAPAPFPDPPAPAAQAPAAPAPAAPVAAPPPPAPAPVAAAPAPPAPAPAQDRPAPAPLADHVGHFDSVLLGEMDDDAPPAPLPIAGDAASGHGHGHGAESDDEGVEVRGVYCKNRHFNDPRQLFCAVCGINMVQQTPVLVSGPRPPLGVIVLDDGAVFQIDSDYLLGRDPASDDRVRTGEVRGVPIQDTSNQISRVHARLELRGWDVVLVDSSTNGTFVNPPQTPDWQRLAGGGEHVLTQGTRVRIGHRTLAFNTHAGASS